MKNLTRYKNIPKAIKKISQALMLLNEIDEKIENCFDFYFSSEDLLEILFDENGIKELARHYNVKNTYSEVYNEEWYEIKDEKEKKKAEDLFIEFEERVIAAIQNDLTNLLENEVSGFLTPYIENNEININFALSIKPEFSNRKDIDGIIDTLYNLFNALENGEI